jgi:tetratricopeptide (TPR) repeat protein
MEISRNAYNLALCRMVEGNLAGAAGLLDQAESLAGVKGAEASLILLAKSEVARLSGKSAESEQLARQAVDAGADREGRVHALLLQGEAALVSGHNQGGVEHYRSARSGVSGQTPALIRARIEALAVQLIHAGVLSGDIGAIQLSRADWLRKAGQFKEMVSALDGAAEFFEQAGKWSDAFDCRIRSAQSLMAAGNRDAALQSANRAKDLAEKSGQASQKALAAGVIKELN